MSNSGTVCIALNSYTAVQDDDRYYNGTKSVSSDPNFSGDGFPPPFTWFSSTIDAGQEQTSLSFIYNGGLYDAGDPGPFEIPPYPTAVTSLGWRAHGGNTGGFILGNIGSSFRIDAVRVVVNSSNPSSANSQVDVTIGSTTIRLDSGNDIDPDDHIGEWLLPTVTAQQIAVTWAAVTPNDGEFAFVLFEVDFTLIGPYLLNVNGGLPVQNESTEISMQGRNLEAMTSFTIDGVTQLINGLGTSTPTFDLVRASLKYSVHTALVTDGTHDSSVATSLAPQAGWVFVDVETPYPIASVRVQTSPDIAEIDQLAYLGLDGVLTVAVDGTIVYYGEMPADIPIEIWSSGDWTAGTLLLDAGDGNGDIAIPPDDPNNTPPEPQDVLLSGGVPDTTGVPNGLTLSARVTPGYLKESVAADPETMRSRNPATRH